MSYALKNLKLIPINFATSVLALLVRKGAGINIKSAVIMKISLLILYRKLLSRVLGFGIRLIFMALKPTNSY